jgi:hypothetical protein
MASSILKLDIPARYMQNFSLSQQTGLQSILNFVLRNQLKPVLLDASGAIPLIGGDFVITKAGVAAMTLAAPSAAQNGLTLTVTSNTANAHTITATGLLNDGVIGGAKTTATFAAFAGASITLRAYEGKWMVLGKNVVTIA